MTAFHDVDDRNTSCFVAAKSGKWKAEENSLSYPLSAFPSPLLTAIPFHWRRFLNSQQEADKDIETSRDRQGAGLANKRGMHVPAS